MMFKHWIEVSTLGSKQTYTYRPGQLVQAIIPGIFSMNTWAGLFKTKKS